MVIEALQRAEPYEQAIRAARNKVMEARSTLSGFERDRGASLPVVRLRFRDRIKSARGNLADASAKLGAAIESATSLQEAVARSTSERDDIERDLAPKRIARQPDSSAAALIPRSTT